jgi:hypothetical protein
MIPDFTGNLFARLPQLAARRSRRDLIPQAILFVRGIVGLFPSKKNRLWNQRSSENVSRVAEDGLGSPDTVLPKSLSQVSYCGINRGRFGAYTKTRYLTQISHTETEPNPSGDLDGGPCGAEGSHRSGLYRVPVSEIQRTRSGTSIGCPVRGLAHRVGRWGVWRFNPNGTSD